MPHPKQSGGQRHHGPQRGHEAEDEDDDLAIFAEQPVQRLDIAPLQRRPAAVAIDQRLQPRKAQHMADHIPEIIADSSADRPGQQQPAHVHPPLADTNAANAHDEFGRDRRKDIFQHHQQENAPIAARIDQAENPVSQTTRSPSCQRTLASLFLVAPEEEGRSQLSLG